MPATYAAIYRVLQECAPPVSLVDIGAGPGTGGWAAAEIFPSLERITCIEPSQPMADIGQRLAQAAPWRSAARSEMEPAKWTRRRPTSSSRVCFGRDDGVAGVFALGIHLAEGASRSYRRAGHAGGLSKNFGYPGVVVTPGRASHRPLPPQRPVPNAERLVPFSRSRRANTSP